MTPDTQHSRTLAQSLTNDDRGVTASGGIGIIAAVLVGALLVAYLLPDAINEMMSTSTSGWGEAGSLYEILPLLVVLACVLFFIGLAVYAVGRL